MSMNFNGVCASMSDLSRLSNAKTRSISPENFTGEKGKGGMCPVEDGSSGNAAREKQPEESPTPYAAMIRKEMGCLDFERAAEELERCIRAMDPWPGAYTHLGGKTLKVWKARPFMDEETAGKPGTVLSADKDGIRVACGRGILSLTEVQLEGKKRMETDAFLRGFHLEPGTLLS